MHFISISTLLNANNETFVDWNNGFKSHSTTEFHQYWHWCMYPYQHQWNPTVCAAIVCCIPHQAQYVNYV